MSARPVVVVPVREGVLPAGAAEAVAEANPAARVILIGSQLGTAAADLAGLVATVELAEVGDFAVGAWATALGPLVSEAAFVVLPGSPDGRDLAARLAAVTGLPLLAGAMEIGADQVTIVHHGGLVQSEVRPVGSFVATLQPGVRGVERDSADSIVTSALDLGLAGRPSPGSDATVVAIEPPDAATVDLAEAPRIVGGGAGMMAGATGGSADVEARFLQLTTIGEAIGASMGATRVVTDAGWVSHERQIGTTGVVVDPELYLAFGISGAVQHTAGLGHPDHVISVNTDPHCPMMAMADLAVVADANATLDQLAALLERPVAADFDVIIVGAGPAGAAAAITAARAGCSVALLERGPFPGSKNMYGGVIYGRILDGLIPNWWEEAPIQRWITRRCTMLMTPTQALTVDYRTTTWGEAPYNGATAYRPDFDNWLAGHAIAAGAEVICSTTATGLLRDGSRVVGVRTDRPDGDLTADVVIACDGVNSFLAKEAGLYTHTEPEHFTVGVKETIALGRDVIDQRFALRGLDGADYEIVGCTNGIPGGGFLYTNLDTVAVGVVLQLPGLGAQDKRPEEIIGALKAHPSIAPLVDGGDVKEYSAHLIPEGGFNMMPELTCDGMIVAGDAAALCLAAGIWLEGVNFAIGSGVAAGAAAVEALRRGDTSDAGLAGYRRRLETNFVLQDHRKLASAPALMMGERLQTRYPEVACNVAERIFTVENPRPKPGFTSIARSELRSAGVKLSDLARDAVAGFKNFG